jgi:hypothetical protein
VSAVDSKCDRTAVIGFDQGERTGSRFRVGTPITQGIICTGKDL